MANLGLAVDEGEKRLGRENEDEKDDDGCYWEQKAFQA